jgi:lipoprotein-anchoring transpeptidase ErfK/SrfK
MAKRLAVPTLLVAALLAGCAPAPVARPGDASQRPPAPSAQSRNRASHRVAARVAVTPAQRPSAPKPKPKPNACAANTAAQLVLVSVAKQHAWMCAGSHLAYDTAVTTGAVELPYDSTPTGTYRIQGKTTDTTLTLLSGATYAVSYWIPFDGPLFGFHDSSWQNFPYGSPRYRTEGSHGCIHMPLAAMKVLYDWAAVGATVTIA